MKNPYEVLVNPYKDIFLKAIDEEDVLFIKDVVNDYKKGVKRNADFMQKFGIELKSVMSYGKTDEVSRKMLDELIPEETYPLAPRPREKSYYCYASKAPSIVLHEEITSAWQCLMNTLGNPEYALIYKK